MTLELKNRKNRNKYSVVPTKLGLQKISSQLFQITNAMFRREKPNTHPKKPHDDNPYLCDRLVQRELQEHDQEEATLRVLWQLVKYF